MWLLIFWPSQIPIEMDIRKGSDDGVPVVISAPDSIVSRAYGEVAVNVVNRLQELAKEQEHPESNSTRFS